MISVEVCKIEPNPSCVCDICDFKIVEYNMIATDGSGKNIANIEFCDDCFSEFIDGCELLAE